MKMAFIVFDGMTMMDLVGFYDAVTRLKQLIPNEDVSWDFCGIKAEVSDDRGMTFKVNQVKPVLAGYDLIYAPGGLATRQLRFDQNFIGWLQTAAEVKYKISVCTGALLLGAAGFLTGKRATTNRVAYDLLIPYCEEVVHARIVRDGNVITGGGVATSIDLGLYVVESFTDADTVQQIQTLMDYPYYKAGHLKSDYIL
ncbi:MAG: thiamine biosynthesis protein ThiJ [Bacilli bacterium]|nr:thiamine biosynthesis protein ThiJ [Bacilli bacterium]